MHLAAFICLTNVVLYTAMTDTLSTRHSSEELLAAGVELAEVNKVDEETKMESVSIESAYGLKESIFFSSNDKGNAW